MTITSSLNIIGLMSHQQQVFISYHKTDSDFAHRIARDLQKIGIQIWIAPESIQPGENYVSAISKSLAESTHVIVILSPSAMQSGWVEAELNAAIKLSIEGQTRLIPVELQACDVPTLVGTYQKVRFEGDYDHGLQLLKSVFKHEKVEFQEEGSEAGFFSETPIGRTVITNPSGGVKSPLAVESSMAFTHPAYKFQLSWPLGGRWSRNEEMEMQMGADLMIMYRKTFADFTPNVNVTTEKVGLAKIRQWLQMGNQVFEECGYSIVHTAYDDFTQSGIRIARHEEVQNILYQIQRAIIYRGVAHVITGSKLEADYDEFPDLYEEMRQIINSFQVLEC